MFHFIQMQIQRKKQLGKVRSSETYQATLNSFMSFRCGVDLTFDMIDSELMELYEAELQNRGLTRNTSSFYLRILRTNYKLAVEKGLTQDCHPFKRVYCGIDKTVKRSLSFAKIKQIKELDLSLTPSLDFARDMFLFSFCTRGMSFVDMAYLKKEQVRNGCITYQRRKTNRQLRVKIHPQAQIIIDRYMVSDPGCPYLFPILYDPEKKTEREYSSALRVYNKRLDSLSSLLELDEPLTSYVARHTWASLARQCGTSDTVISEAMGHSHVGVTTIYLASLDIGMVAMANQRVITSLFRKRIP